MADGVEVKIEGLDDLRRTMLSVSEDVRKKSGRAALRRAAMVIANAAKQNAAQIDDPETSEQIAKNIAVRWSSKINRRTGDLAFRIGVLGGAKISKREPKGSKPGGPGGDTRYWAYVEFGTQKTRANPFMVPAATNNVQMVVSTFSIQLDKALDRAIKKGAA